MPAPDFDPVTGDYVLRITLTHEDARRLEASAALMSWSTARLAAQIIVDRLENPTIGDMRIADLADCDKPS